MVCVVLRVPKAFIHSRSVSCEPSYQAPRTVRWPVAAAVDQRELRLVASRFSHQAETQHVSKSRTIRISPRTTTFPRALIRPSRILLMCLANQCLSIVKVGIAIVAEPMRLMLGKPRPLHLGVSTPGPGAEDKCTCRAPAVPPAIWLVSKVRSLQLMLQITIEGKDLNTLSL